MINLDDKKAVTKKHGGDATVISVNSLPLQLDQSFTEAMAISFPESYRHVANVVICGMGGSRFPALIIQHLYKSLLKVPVTINDDYLLPGFVDENTLVLLSSYSGTTEEIVMCGKLALDKKAKLTGLCVGGEIAEFLKLSNCPAYIFDPKHNPSGQPRIGFGYGVGGVLGLLMNLRLINDKKESITSAIAHLPKLLNSFTIETPRKDNLSKQLAEKVYNLYPYFVVAEFLTGVGNATQNQFNETAKTISSFRVIPELNHHLLEGLKHPDEHVKMGLFILFFSRLYSERVQKRFKITKDVIEQNKLKTMWIELNGLTKIEQAFEVMGLGNYASMYLAALYQENPNVIPFVDYFKKELAK